VAAVARAKAIAARRARARVEHADETWSPPACLPEPRLPRTAAGTTRTLRKLARRKHRFEVIQMADAAVEMPRLAPGPPVSIEAGMAELNRRCEVAVLASKHELSFEQAEELQALL